MNAVDTNILFYAHDPRDPAKQQIATNLIAGLTEGTLLWQVACEYLSASRKLEPIGYSYSDAVEDIRSLRRVWNTVVPNWKAIDRLEALRANYSLSFWDGLLIAACLESGVRRLYSEDFSGYGRIESVEVVDPFRVGC